MSLKQILIGLGIAITSPSGSQKPLPNAAGSARGLSNTRASEFSLTKFRPIIR